MIAFAYVNAQVDLACLDTFGRDDWEAYGLCLRFAMTSSCVEAVGQMFSANKALPFETIDYETWEEREHRWRSLDEQRRAA